MQFWDGMFTSIGLIVNKVLLLDPDFQGRLLELDGKVLQYHVLGVGKDFYIKISGDQLVFNDGVYQEPDVEISASPIMLFALLTTSDSMQLLRSENIQITGDAEVGRKFKAILSALDIDWEELLAEKIGDVGAHYIGSGLHKFLSWEKRARDAIDASVSEYLQEESKVLPTQIEAQNFCHDVDMLREATDRLLARFTILQSKLVYDESSNT